MLSGQDEPVDPTPRLLEVREALRSQAIPAAERALRVSDAALRALAGQAAADVRKALGGSHPAAQTGWTLMSAGTVLTRNAGELVPKMNDNPDDAFESGLLWTGIVVAAAGDSLIDAGADPALGGGDPNGLRGSARRLADEVLGLFSSAESRRRFGEDVADQLVEGLPALDRRQAGRTLAAVGVWCAVNDATIAAAVGRRRRLGRGRDTARVALGCGFAGALLAAAGGTMLDD